jgi:hypothetical protein
MVVEARQIYSLASMPTEPEAPESSALIHRDPTGPHPTGDEIRKLLLALGRYLLVHPDATDPRSVLATAALLAGDHGAAAHLAGSRPAAPAGVSSSEEWVVAGREWYDQLFGLIERRENILDPIVVSPPAWIVEIVDRAGHVTARYIAETKDDVERVRAELPDQGEGRGVIIRQATEVEAELESVHVHGVRVDSTGDSLRTATAELTVRLGNRLVECQVTLRQNQDRPSGDDRGRSFDIQGSRDSWASQSLLAALAEVEGANEDFDCRPIVDAIAAAVDEAARAWGLDD